MSQYHPCNFEDQICKPHHLIRNILIENIKGKRIITDLKNKSLRHGISLLESHAFRVGNLHYVDYFAKDLIRFLKVFMYGTESPCNENYIEKIH